MTVSAGVATVPDRAIDSIDDLIRAADRALYRAKDLGKNRVIGDESSSRPFDAGTEEFDDRAAQRRRRAAGRRRRPSPDASASRP